ncbi:hypothetical protein [Maribacter sp. 2307ULW6-5]|uniref:hypothetical protein n=1 Tax=Maribacter sp. 2307ULW6-5 TaxID=3386275 RepID=UPI0039BD075E
MKPFLRTVCLCLAVFAQTGYGQKSAITIEEPTKGTVWTVEEMARIRWSTDNISPEKSIRFFLVRNEMVVQELGSFENNGFKDAIALAKNIGSGDQYQVVGIELFPEDKFNIAKFVTPLFSIVNKASDARRKQQELKNAPPEKPSKKNKRKRRSKRNTPLPRTTEDTSPKTDQRMEFNGRTISYTKELEFSSDEITVKIWDHGRQDGDIVSIYLNGRSVVSKHYLTYWKREFKIKLNPQKTNDLFLYAHNLGDAPPNTVAVEISDGIKSENIVLNSDLQSCEAVMISVNK